MVPGGIAALLRRRPTLEATPWVEMAGLRRLGAIAEGAAFVTVLGADGSCDVSLVWRPRHFGGARPYFRCCRCDGLALKLYLGAGAAVCRRCIGRPYAQHVRNNDAVAFGRLRRIAERLGGAANERLTFPARPKGLHRETYFRVAWVWCMYAGVLDERWYPEVIEVLNGRLPLSMPSFDIDSRRLADPGRSVKAEQPMGQGGEDDSRRSLHALLP